MYAFQIHFDQTKRLNYVIGSIPYEFHPMAKFIRFFGCHFLPFRKQVWIKMLLSSIAAAALMHKKPPHSVAHDNRHPAVSIKDFAKHSKQMQKDSHHAITEEYKVSFFLSTG